MFVSKKPLHVSVFFSRPSSGGPPLCFVPLLFLPLICIRWVCIITQYVAACLCHLCVFRVLVCWCSCLLVILSVGDLLVFTSRSPTDKNTKHAQMTYTCGHILRNNTNSTNEIRGRNSNGTKHSGGPPEDGREKRLKHVRVLYLQTRF